MSKQEVEALVQSCADLGWAVENTAKGFHKVTPPGKNPIIVSGTANGGRTLANFKAELKRAGYNPDAAAAAKAAKATNNLLKDRRKNEAALARAAQRASDAALAPAPTPAPAVPVPAVPTLANPFSPGAASEGALTTEGGEINQFKALQGYPRRAVAIGQKQAAEIWAYAKEQQEKENGCRQRKLYSTNVAKIKQGMELGEWYLNPADALVFCKEHKSLVNGGHRMWTLSQADPEFIEGFYANGELPFEVVEGFPCRMSHIFDQGKSRSGVDALAFDGQTGWTNLAVGALRIALQYDESFQEGGETYWPRWRKKIVTNSEVVAIAGEEYKDILKMSTIANRAYNRSKVTRSASMVAAFLFERDNPGGNPKLGLTNELFWKGVSDDDDMMVGDARRALIRVAARTSAGNIVDNGPTMLAYLLKAYAKYMSNKPADNLGNVDQIRAVPMLPVWTPQLRWHGTKLVPRA